MRVVLALKQGHRNGTIVSWICGTTCVVSLHPDMTRWNLSINGIQCLAVLTIDDTFIHLPEYTFSPPESDLYKQYHRAIRNWGQFGVAWEAYHADESFADHDIGRSRWDSSYYIASLQPTQTVRPMIHHQKVATVNRRKHGRPTALSAVNYMHARETKYS